jgi:hypothetical protein
MRSARTTKTSTTTMLATLLGLFIATVGTTSVARAGCRDMALPGAHASPARFIPADFRPARAMFAGFTPVSDSWNDDASIVGLWEFEVRLNGAQNGMLDKALFDWGLATWHSDQTEIQFSAGRTPAAGDVCMGAWQQVGRNKFKLHHIALGLTPPIPSGAFIGPAIIRSEVTVNPAGNRYTGWYTLSLYPGSPSDGTEFNESGTPIVTFVGTITAHRVTAD